MERELGHGDAGGVQAVDRDRQRLVAGDGDGDRPAGGEDGERGADLGDQVRRSPRGRSGSAGRTVSVWPPTMRLRPVGVSWAITLAVVDHRDLVGERVGLLQVLRGQQDRRAVVDEVAHDAPHVLALGGVEAGRGLVQEDDARAADEAGGEVEAAAHAAASTCGRGGPRRPGGRTTRAAPCARALGVLALEVEQRADQLEVLAAGQQLVDARVLAGEADLLAHAGGLGGDVVARDDRGALVGLQQRREDAHRRGLAGAVGAEHAEHGTGPRGEIDAVQRLGVPEGLAQAPGFDRVVHAQSFGGRRSQHARTALTRRVSAYATMNV